MIDYKLLQGADYQEAVMNDSPSKLYKPDPRTPDTPYKKATTLNTFYADKERYLALEELLGKELATKWMLALIKD